MKLLVIDIQKGITDTRLYNFESFIDNTTRIIGAARANQVTPMDGEKIFIKDINSCFGNNEFADYIKHEDALMIVGLQTNFCIDATVKSAFERGYNVIIPQGANSTFDNDYMTGEVTYRYYNEMMWPKRFAICVSVEDAIRLLNQR